jgi:hypothetical protein
MSAETTQAASSRTRHTWRFFRAGGFDQVRLDTGADLAHLDELDQKLWVSLACPTRGLEFDTKTLDLIDTDKDGRIRAPEILAAVKWAASCLKNPDDLTKGFSALPLAAINDATPEGKQLLASARQILANLGKSDATAISLDDTTDTTKIFAQTKFNGDGIVPADSADDAPTQAVISDIIACLGADIDRSSKPGVSQAKVDQFFAEAQAYSDWQKKAETEAASICPLGDKTAEAAAALKAVKAKVDDYFARCRLAAFDPRSLAAVNRQESEYLALAAKDMSITAEEVAGFPVARIEASRPLPLKDGINPAWAAAVASLNARAVKPLLGDKASLTEAEWAAITAKFAAYDAWLAAKAGGSVEKLGLQRVREIRAGKSKEAIAALIAKDKALEPEANAMAAVDRLVRYCRDLHKLLNNFVTFRDFYGRAKAVFQAGTLYLDQRSCDLCLTVEDAGKHASMAGLAGTYLAYCDCVRKSTGEKMQIVAAFTDGDSDNLMVGRNGLFYDRKGRDWDATIAKIVDNPISLRQAFWAPYKKLVRMMEEQVAKRAAAADAASAAKLEATAAAAATADKAKPAEPKKIDTGTVAALGVGVGAIATVLGGFVAGFVKLVPWQMVLAVIGIILVISGPSMLIAWLKLRKRNLGPILDANGWAVNAKAKLTVPFGKALTQVAKLPAGSERDLTDPYAEKKSPWPTIIVLALILWAAYAVLNKMGYIHDWTKGRLGDPKAVKVEQTEAQAGAAATVAVTNAPAK